jgi:hypothetical protein
MAKQKISDADLVDALNGLYSTYDRLSGDGQDTIDTFLDKAESPKGFTQKDLDKFIEDLDHDEQRMNQDGLHYYDILKNAKL